MDRWRMKQYDKEYDEFEGLIYDDIRLDIVQTCDKMGWSMTSLTKTIIYDAVNINEKGHPIEVGKDTHPEATRLHELLSWYIDKFNPPFLFSYKNGQWHDYRNLVRC